MKPDNHLSDPLNRAWLGIAIQHARGSMPDDNLWATLEYGINSLIQEIEGKETTWEAFTAPPAPPLPAKKKCVIRRYDPTESSRY